MERITEIYGYNIRLPDKTIAALLGISLTDYLLLVHRPLEAYTDEQGQVTEFYMHISSGNSQRILDKLNLDKSNFVRFSPEEIYIHIAPLQPEQSPDV